MCRGVSGALLWGRSLLHTIVSMAFPGAAQIVRDLFGPIVLFFRGMGSLLVHAHRVRKEKGFGAAVKDSVHYLVGGVRRNVRTLPRMAMYILPVLALGISTFVMLSTESLLSISFSSSLARYGGDVAVRKWLGRQAKEKPLTGHHLGLYGQVLTYDFETGHRGYMGGEPGGTLFDRASLAGGIEYGYSLPVARRLNIDFCAGVGYLGGKYYEYVPMDDCYVWQSTKMRRYFGPTKVEVSLVWLLGKGNYNAEKGGRR